jgi:DNA-binding CsgD family transcriptional regulator
VTDVAEAPALASVLQPSAPLSLHLRRVTGSVVGRPVEISTIQKEIDVAKTGRLAAVTVEGEPGIGKTRLLLAASEIAAAKGFAVIAVASDEEIRGPFLLARSILGAPEAAATAAGTPAEEPCRRSMNSLRGVDEAGLESLPPDQKLLRALDLAAVAVRALTEEKPVALLIDDFQWADDDSIRLLRYVVRSAADTPLFLMLAIRPEELAFVNEAVNLIADMERLGLVRRQKLSRFTQVETAEFIQHVLGGKVEGASAATMHAQAEGVPFVVEELAHTYRDAGMIQEMDGVWRLARNAERLVPSAVRTLISRRAARVPDDTKAALAEAAVLGRRFSLKDLTALRSELGEEEVTTEELDLALGPAVSTGLLIQHGEDSPADYSFAHEQVREFAAASLSQARRRAIHGAIVKLLLSGDPAPASLPLLAYHAKAAGDAQICIRFSLEAIHNALDASAPEEVLRVVDLALPVAATPQERVDLLDARDRALDMLRRSSDRLEGLAELAALAEALGDTNLELEVQLRRAAALRSSDEWEQAAVLARRTRERAAEEGNKRAELSACLEIGQALLHTALGEGYSLPTPDEIEYDGAEEAYERAADVAKELGDDASRAAALRELGVLDFSRVRAHFVSLFQMGQHLGILERIAAGETLEQVVSETPVAPKAHRAFERFQESLEIFERIGDRRGAMSTIIAMAYATWGADIHFGSGAGRHIEEIRRLASRMDAMTKESERSLAEAQMLYGAHVFARAKVVPDLALSRGAEAYKQAKIIGDRSLEFLSAGGTAMAHLDLGEVEEAKAWIDRAAATAADNPTPFRARQLESWRGLLASASGDAGGMRSHLERAVELASKQGLPPARCEALAILALEASRLGAERSDDELLAVAENAARDVKEHVGMLPGHPPWGKQANAALARIALSKGDVEGATAAARSALQEFIEGQNEDAHLEVQIPVVQAIEAGGNDMEKYMAKTFLRVMLAMTVQRTVDDEVRVRWLRGPVGRELARLAGPLDAEVADTDGHPSLDSAEAELLSLLVQGLTNREISERLGVDEQTIARRLADMIAKIGASSRAEATAFAFQVV